MQLETLAVVVSTFGFPFAAAIAWIVARRDRMKDERISRLKAWGEGLEYAEKAKEPLLKEVAYQVGLDVRTVSLREVEAIQKLYPDDPQRIIRLYELHSDIVLLEAGRFVPRGRRSLTFRAVMCVIGYVLSAGLALVLGQAALKGQFQISPGNISLVALASSLMLLAITLLLRAFHLWEARKLLTMRPVEPDETPLP